jgi:hypothetical protein
MNRSMGLTWILILAALPAAAAEERPVRFAWTELPPLPPAPGRAAQPGVAGPFVGVHAGALLVAGGANFPDAPPWEGGIKTYWDSLFVLVKSASGAPAWVRDERLRLLRPLAYGAAVDTPAGLLCIGGCDAERCYLENPDAIFPWYIATQLPAGVSGLLVAGVFAASMSTLSSCMNSVATAFVTDFYRPFRPGAAERVHLAVTRGATIAVGVLGVGLAWVLAAWDIRSLWDQFVTFLGLFGGGLGGLFMLAILARRATAAGALAGFIASAAVQALLQVALPVHPWFFPVSGMVACVAVGYAASLVLPAARKPLDGLTIYTLGPAGAEPGRETAKAADEGTIPIQNPKVKTGTSTKGKARNPKTMA